MARLARPAGRDELAGPDPGDRGAGLEHQPGGGVAERHVLARRPSTAWRVAAIPSVRALRTTWRTRSGLARALASRLDCARAVTARSVPGEITEETRADQHLGRFRVPGTARRAASPGRR